MSRNIDDELDRLHTRIRRIEALRKMYPDLAAYGFKFFSRESKKDAIAITTERSEGNDGGTSNLIHVTAYVDVANQQIYRPSERRESYSEMPTLVYAAEITIDELVRRLNEDEDLKRKVIELICADEEIPF